MELPSFVRIPEEASLAPGGSVAYLLGAGATRADYPSIPLMDELLHRIVESGFARNSLGDFLSQIFGEECLRPDTPAEERPRLDDVFTLIDAHLTGRAPSPSGRSRERLIEARRHLIASIGRVIARSIGDGVGRTALKFSKALAEAGTTLISTNYDIVMDNALLERSSKNVNYGVPVREAVHRWGDLEGGRFGEMHHYRPIPGSQEIVRRGGIPLLKLNGSLNWLYCPRCDELDITLLQSKGALTLLEEPVLGRCCREGCTCPYEPVLVGPSLEQRYEHRVLRDTWTFAERALQSSHRLVIIGYSLPDADYLIRAMLARTFSPRSADVTVVTMVDDPSEKRRFERRFRRLFPRCTFMTGGFSRFVDDLLVGRREAREE